MPESLKDHLAIKHAKEKILAPLDKESLEQIAHILHEIQQDNKSVVVLSNEEVEELKQWLQDKKALGRAWAIFKTALITIAATVVAWNTILENVFSVALNYLGFGGSK